MAALSSPVAALVAVESPVHAPAGALAGATRFALGPGMLLGALGLLRRGDPTVAAPAPGWREAAVDVVIAVGRDQGTIVHCLAGLHAQTRRPRRIVLVEAEGAARDGSIALAREFAMANFTPIEVARPHGGGRLALLREQASALDGDVLVLLDAHTVLDSRDYLERCVRELYRGAGVASACGCVLPLRDADRRRWAANDAFRRWLAGDVWRDPLQPRNRAQRALRWLGDTYRECAGLIQQRIVQRGQMRAFGSIAYPSGAVAFRRARIEALFAPPAALPPGGPYLEEIFVGLALANEGYRAAHVPDVIARIAPSRLAALPAQRLRYAHAFLSGGARFAPLLRPRLRRARIAPPVHEQRRIAEPYRQPFGAWHTRERGRPVGWALAGNVLDEVAVPALLLALLVLAPWPWLAAGFALESGLWLAALALAAPASRWATLGKGVLVAPLRYVEIAADAVAACRFGYERWRGMPGRG